MTLKNSNMFGANAKVLNISNSLALVGAAKKYIGAPVYRKITVTNVFWFTADIIGAFSTTFGAWALYKGTTTAIAAARANANLTGLTSIATLTATAATIAAAGSSQFTLTATAADRDVDGVPSTVTEGLVMYAAPADSSQTLPVGTLYVEYVLRDVDP